MIWNTQKKSAIGFALALVILLAISFLTYRSITKLIGEDERAARTYEILNKLEDVL